MEDPRPRRQVPPHAGRGGRLRGVLPEGGGRDHVRGQEVPGRTASGDLRAGAGRDPRGGGVTAWPTWVGPGATLTPRNGKACGGARGTGMWMSTARTG